MPTIVEFPAVVKEALEQVGQRFANDPERVHFAEYLTGLLVAARKNVSAIHREFVHSGDPSCLNRWLTEADWDADKLNQARLDWLQKDPSTRYSSHGVIALDNVLIDHDGQLIEDAAGRTAMRTGRERRPAASTSRARSARSAARKSQKTSLLWPEMQPDTFPHAAAIPVSHAASAPSKPLLSRPARSSPTLRPHRVTVRGHKRLSPRRSASRQNSTAAAGPCSSSASTRPTRYAAPSAVAP